MSVLTHSTDRLTSAQRDDMETMEVLLLKKITEWTEATSEGKRREAAERILRAAADIYAWSK